MGILDWLFGKDEEEEEPPEFLVLGAKLKCPYGEKESFLYVDAEEISLNHLPEACVTDNKALINILPFGSCRYSTDGLPCEVLMRIEKEWENLKPQTKRINGKEVITTESTLQCELFGFQIEALSSGQDGFFARQVILIRELNERYPGLLEVLDDPKGSLYRSEGMYKVAIQFLEDEIRNYGGEIQIPSLYASTDLESKYILKSLERLLPLANREGSWEELLTVIENAMVSSQVENNADKWILNDDMVEILKVKSEQLADSAVFRFGEENKAMIDYASNTITSWAYGMLGYHSMRNLTKGKNQVEEEWNAAVQKYKGSINKEPKIKGAKFSSKNVTALKENSPVKNTIQRGPVIKGVKFSQRSGKNPEMKVEPEGNGQGVKVLPQGITQESYTKASELIRNNVGDISDDIMVQGSRAAGTAKATSDIDIAIRVSDDSFNELINKYFKSPNSGSAKERTMLHAIETGKIQAGEAGLRGLRKQLEGIFNMEVDISIIKKGGSFDNPPYIPLE